MARNDISIANVHNIIFSYHTDIVLATNIGLFHLLDKDCVKRIPMNEDHNKLIWYHYLNDMDLYIYADYYLLYYRGRILKRTQFHTLVIFSYLDIYMTFSPGDTLLRILSQIILDDNTCSLMVEIEYMKSIMDTLGLNASDMRSVIYDIRLHNGVYYFMSDTHAYVIVDIDNVIKIKIEDTLPTPTLGNSVDSPVYVITYFPKLENICEQIRRTGNGRYEYLVVEKQHTCHQINYLQDPRLANINTVDIDRSDSFFDRGTLISNPDGCYYLEHRRMTIDIGDFSVDYDDYPRYISHSIRKYHSTPIDNTKDMISTLINVLPALHEDYPGGQDFVIGDEEERVLANGNGVTSSIITSISDEIDTILDRINNNDMPYVDNYSYHNLGRTLYICHISSTIKLTKMHPCFFRTFIQDAYYRWAMTKLFPDKTYFIDTYNEITKNPGLIRELDIDEVNNVHDYVDYVLTTGLTMEQKIAYDMISTGFNRQMIDHEIYMPIDYIYVSLLQYCRDISFNYVKYGISQEDFDGYIEMFQKLIPPSDSMEYEALLYNITGRKYGTILINVIFKEDRKISDIGYQILSCMEQLVIYCPIEEKTMDDIMSSLKSYDRVLLD